MAPDESRRFCQGETVPSLVDPLPDDARALLQVIGEGYIAAGGQWPVWQYVLMRLQERSIDAASVLLRLPTWQQHYRPVAMNASGSMPDLNQPVALTMHGVVHAGGSVASLLVPAVLVSLRLAADQQDSITPNPRQVVPVEVTGDRFTQQVNMTAGSSLSERQLFEALKREPVGWGGLREDGATWRWDLTQLRLRPFRGLATGEEYLLALEDVVGMPAAPITTRPLAPLALLDALDHLDLAWRLTTKEKLIRLPRAALIGRLTLPALSAEEFESRCSALADVFASLNLPDSSADPRPGPLRRWAAFLEAILAEDAPPAIAAVDVLRRVAGVRNSQQHTGSAARYERDRRALGLHQFGSNWAGAWEHLRATCIDALDTIREALVSRFDRKGGYLLLQ